MKRAARRLLHGLLVLWLLSLLSFVVSVWAPGDYFASLMLESRASRETVDSIRQAEGLDRPLSVRYVAWLGSALRGEFGRSLVHGVPAGSLLRERAGATLLLTSAATLAAWLLAFPLGIWCALHRGALLERAAAGGLIVLLAVPELLLVLCALIVAARTGWFPPGGMTSPGAASGSARDVLWHIALPCSVLVLSALPVLVRHVRSAMSAVLDAPFAWNARAQGIGGWRLLLRHLLPAAANPLISLAGASLGMLLSGSLLVEVVLDWPGVGPLLLNAIMARDFPVVMCVVMASAAFLIAGNLVADLLLGAVDPRIRME